MTLLLPYQDVEPPTKHFIVSSTTDGTANIYAMDDTSVPRTITIRAEDEFIDNELIFSDYGLQAGTNTLTVTTASGKLIDSQSSVFIDVDGGAIKLRFTETDALGTFWKDQP